MRWCQQGWPACKQGSGTATIQNSTTCAAVNSTLRCCVGREPTHKPAYAATALVGKTAVSASLPQLLPASRHKSSMAVISVPAMPLRRHCFATAMLHR